VSGPRLWSFLASALLGGLALLTKAPSLLLLPYAGLLLFARSPRPGLWPRLRWSLGWYLPWLLIAVALVFAGWPAMWVAPQTAIADVANEIINNGGQPTDTGNYFMGQAVPVPGPLFYGVVVLLRSTPLTLLGGLALLGFGLYRLAAWRQRASTPAEQGERRTLLALLGFALYFGAVMNIEPKQFDRYLLPIWPALEILAAAGLFHGYRAGAALVGRLAARPGAAGGGRAFSSSEVGRRVALRVEIVRIPEHGLVAVGRRPVQLHPGPRGDLDARHRHRHGDRRQRRRPPGR